MFLILQENLKCACWGCTVEVGARGTSLGGPRVEDKLSDNPDSREIEEVV